MHEILPQTMFLYEQPYSLPDSTLHCRAAPTLKQNLRSRAELEKLEAAKDASFDYLWLTFLTFGYLSLPFHILTGPYWALLSLTGPYFAFVP